MSSLSISIIRHHYNPFIPNTVHRCATSFRSLCISASRNHNRESISRKSQQPSKHLLKARDAVKHFSSLSPSLTSTDTFNLSPDQAIGKVASAQANFMRVVVESAKSLSPEEGNGVELLCVVRNLLKKIKRRVLVGDKVLVGSIDWIDRRGMIENVFERKTEVVDPPVANVDHLLVLFSLDQPKLEEFSLTRFLVEAESTQIPVTLALNKVELVDKETQVSWKSKLRSWGYEPIFCSVETKTGLDSLQFNLRDQTSVIVGPSGVGKSSLINALRSNHFGLVASDMDDWPNSISGSKWLEDQRVGEVSARSGRGKHTTRHVSLLPLSGGGYIADTPGFNQPSLLKVTTQSLALCFPEVRKILSASEPSRCAFSNCLHLGEPGCLMKEDWERHPYYFQLLDEIKIREEFQLRTLGTKREGDVRCAYEILSNHEGRYSEDDCEDQKLLGDIDNRMHGLQTYLRRHYWIDGKKLHFILSYQMENDENKFNINPNSLPEWMIKFSFGGGGYFIGNVSLGRMDFRWFLMDNCLAILSSLATPEQAMAIMTLIDHRWNDIVGEMPLKMVYPPLFDLEWIHLTGFRSKEHVLEVSKRGIVARYKMGDMGVKQAEPRLEMKKHRRQSRKKVNQSFLDDLEEELEDDNESFLEDDPIIRAMENENQ